MQEQEGSCLRGAGQQRIWAQTLGNGNMWGGNFRCSVLID